MDAVKQEYTQKYSGFESISAFKNECAFFEPQVKKLQHQILNKINLKTKTALDLGCGFGIKTFVLSKYFKSVVGIDFIENIIEVNKLLSKNSPNLQFQCLNGVAPESIFYEKFDMVTALGYSPLNTSNLELYVKEIERIYQHYLAHDGTLIIWSFTDFSGKAPTGWYNHTKNELKILQDLIKNTTKKNVTIYYPHGKIDFNSFFSLHGIKRLVRFFQRKKYYFLIVSGNEF